MAKSPRKRLSPDSPIIHEHVIIDTQDIKDIETWENITICKYVQPRKNGDNWEDVVMKEWVSNPSKIDLLWMKIRVEKSIVE